MRAHIDLFLASSCEWSEPLKPFIIARGLDSAKAWREAHHPPGEKISDLADKACIPVLQ